MRIGIAGTHCSGKTTLATAIAAEYDLPLIEEVAARFPRETRGSLNVQFQIMDAQIAAEAGAGTDFVSDRTVMDNAAYIAWTARSQPWPVVPSWNRVVIGQSSPFTIVREGESRAIEHLIARPYDLVVFVDEYFPPEENGVRSLDADQQVFIHETLKRNRDFYSRSAGIENVMTVKGDHATRMDRVCRAIEEIWDRPVDPRED